MEMHDYHNFSALLVGATTWLSLQALTIPHTVREVQESHVELKLNRAHSFCSMLMMLSDWRITAIPQR
jgi:hypothetical protein